MTPAGPVPQERELRRLKDAEAVAQAAAAIFAECAREAIPRHGTFTVALAGGETPRRAYELVAANCPPAFPWNRVHVLFGDERCVPAGSAESNAAMAAKALFERVPIPVGNVHRIQGELGPELAADAYEAVLRQGFRGVRSPGFDLVFLGLGEDGHTASLFPGHEALREGEHWVAPVRGAPKPPSERVTLTLAGLAGARRVVFLVTGASKRQALAAVLSDPDAPRRLPAAAVRAAGPITWLADEAAAPATA